MSWRGLKQNFVAIKLFLVDFQHVHELEVFKKHNILFPQRQSLSEESWFSSSYLFVSLEPTPPWRGGRRTVRSKGCWGDFVFSHSIGPFSPWGVFSASCMKHPDLHGGYWWCDKCPLVTIGHVWGPMSVFYALFSHTAGLPWCICVKLWVTVCPLLVKAGI